MNSPRRYLDLRLEAAGRSNLLPLLEAAFGAMLEGRFRLDGLLAVGRQSFVFAATDLTSGGQVVIKQPAFDYSNPLPYSRAEVARARKSLLTEYEILRASPTGYLPRPIALITVAPLVPAATVSPAFAVDEVFLVEERIRGATLTQLALASWPGFSLADREEAVRRIICDFIEFWEMLQDAGWHYSDLSADNLILEEGSGRLRVLDGGSAIPSGSQVLLQGYTPAFTTPTLFKAVTSGQMVAGDLTTILPPLAKVLHFALTKQEPFNGLLPDLTAQAFSYYSAECRATLTSMLALDAQPSGLSTVRETLARWING